MSKGIGSNLTKRRRNSEKKYKTGKKRRPVETKGKGLDSHITKGGV